MVQNNNQKDAGKDDRKDEEIILKGIRTLDSDLKEYKKKVEKYGEDQVFSYDPYLSKNSNNIAPTPPPEVRKTIPAPAPQKEAVEVEKPKTGIVKAPVKEVKSEAGKKEEEDEEDNTPFVELLKNKKSKTVLDYDTVYDTDDSVTGKVPLPKKPVTEKIGQDQSVISALHNKEDEADFRETAAAITKEHSEWKQKLEYYEKNQSKILEEREDLILNKEDVERMLKPILEREKSLESMIKVIEDKIEATLDEDQKRAQEKERWAKEDERQKLEREKWAYMEDLGAVVKQISDKDRTYETLVSKQNEAKSRLSELEKTKEAAEAKLRLREIKRLKVDIESNKTKLEVQIRDFGASIERLNKVERSIVLEKRAIDEREHQTKDSAEEKIMETKRWDIEDKLRKVEQERWQIVDKQKRLLEIMKDINEQYTRILREEKENLAKIK